MDQTSFIDLHCHTVYSDGSFSPEAVVGQAVAAGVTVLAITDHDELGYWERASAFAATASIRLIPGVELSARHRGKDVHILGYGFDPAHSALRDGIARYKAERYTRAERMVKRLQELGLAIEMSNIANGEDAGALGRPHLARHLYETGQVRSVQEAFDLYLAEGRPACMEKAYLSPTQACGMIRAAGGVPVVAHAKLNGVEALIPDLVEMGLGGIEVLHSQHDTVDRARLAETAARYGLVKTGGSDFHGAVKPDVHFGDVQTPLEWLDPLDTAIARAQDGPGARRT